MSLLGKFWGSNKSKSYADGVVLLEAGDFAGAIDALREAVHLRAGAPAGSVATFHFRRALVAEGRRLLRAEDYAGAIPHFAEAVGLWGLYPDLHCLHGTACGLDGDWETSLLEARAALRLNPDYAEARLLEATSLQVLQRLVESADSLGALIESGRRVEHWVIASLTRDEAYNQGNLPENLRELLAKALGGKSEKEEVSAAVAQCRLGNWDVGLESFARLVKKRPRYPDYRTRHAAALFQLRRNEEALAEVEAALALNDCYNTAIDLKGLILADSGQITAARTFLLEADERLEKSRPGSAHEELFGAYLRGVLSLLCGDTDEISQILEPWPDLVPNFGMAALLLAAADDLSDRALSCGRMLTELTAEWAAEADYHFMLACHHLAHRQYNDVAGVLSRWPVDDQTGDWRLEYLESSLSLCQGRVPILPPKDQFVLAAGDSGNMVEVAWDSLAVRIAFLEKDDQKCWLGCQKLVAAGFATERILKIMIACAPKEQGDPGKAVWDPPGILPESCMPGRFFQLMNQGRTEEAQDLLDKQKSPHPEISGGWWLSASFWLAPIRGWIA
jgi:tetratricopeptide (TPR) repeat protein